MQHRAIVWTVAALALTADSANAQSIFVAGTVFSHVFRASSFKTESPTRDDTDISGTSRGTAVAVGTRIRERAVIQVELAFPETLRHTFDPPVSVSPLPPPASRLDRSVEYRTRHGSLLGGYVTDRKYRVATAFLGGVMFLEERVRTVTRFTPLLPFPPPSVSDATTTTYRVAPAFGLDVDVAVVSGLSVVPQMRVYRASSFTGPGVVGLWPGVSVRWTF